VAFILCSCYPILIVFLITFLEVAIALLQGYVFTILMYLYIISLYDILLFNLLMLNLIEQLLI
jgi:F0F1-type ATP synthase membrane subunit a